MLSFVLIASIFFLYPLVLILLSALRSPGRDPDIQPDDDLPSVTCIVIARNADSLIEKKIENCFDLDYPEGLIDFIFYSDASADETAELMQSVAGKKHVLVETCEEHKGKLAALNWAAAHGEGELLLFTDADAILEASALRQMVRHFDNQEIGGVCGKRVIGEHSEALKDSQAIYIRFSTNIQRLESQVASVTANDGKIYTIRRELFTPIAESVTDDMFVCLSVVLKGYRFIYEPLARALIRLPSRSVVHEITRRRRIVSTGLRSIYLHAPLLNPLKYGVYSIGLFINKLLRRLLPFFLITLFATNLLLLDDFYYRLFFVAQLAFYTLGAAHLFSNWFEEYSRPLFRITSTVAYFCAGNFGTLMGVLDFLSGRKINRWEPKKL